jgi:hypothetical protein
MFCAAAVVGIPDERSPMVAYVLAENLLRIEPAGDDSGIGIEVELVAVLLRLRKVGCSGVIGRRVEEAPKIDGVADTVSLSFRSFGCG